MTKKRGSVDPLGSADGKKEKRPRVKETKKPDRETMKPSFMIRLTAEKVGDTDQWISGSMDQTPDIVEILKSEFFGGRLSLEKGENGQLHWQILVLCGKTRKRRQAVRTFLEGHFDGLVWPECDYCEPTQNIWASKEYVMKEESHVCGPWEWNIDAKPGRDLKAEHLNEPYQWQSDLLDLYSEEPPMGWNKVDWYYDPVGQIGKTDTCKRLALRKDSYLLDGGAQKMKFQAAKNPAMVYMMNLSRTTEDKFSYGGLESICDQVYCDTFGSDQKGMVLRKPSWVLVFANWAPEMGKLSKGRIRIWEFVEDNWKLSEE